MSNVNVRYHPVKEVPDNWNDFPELDYERKALNPQLPNPLINELLIDGKLEDIQVDILSQILEIGGAVLSAEMGIGKTYVGVALTRLVRCMYPDKKVIITAPTSVVNNFKTVANKLLGELILTSNGEASQVERFKANFKYVNIFIVTQSFWLNSEDTLRFMYNNADKFSMAFYDEADSKDALGFDVYMEFSRLLPVKVVSNATPIDKDTDLARNLLYAVGATNMSKKRFKRTYTESKYKGSQLISEKVLSAKIKRDFGKYFINKNRTELGVEVDIETVFHKVNINNTQREWISRGMRADLAMYSPENNSVVNNLHLYEGCVQPEITKDNLPAFAKLLQILIENSNTKIMIYAKNRSTLYKMSTLVGLLGYNSYVINGSSSQNSKEITEKFNKDSKGIVLTNIIKGINLDEADRIILYGTPPDIMQTIYRTIRGRESKSITVDWIYYPEYEYTTLIKTKEHVSSIDDLTERQTKLIHDIDKEIASLRGYSYMPRDAFSGGSLSGSGIVQTKPKLDW